MTTLTILGSAIYFANILNAMFIFMFLIFTACLCVYALSFMKESFCDSDEELKRAKSMTMQWKKRALPILIASALWIGLVPDGKTYLKIKAANTFGDGRFIEVLEILDDKLIKEHQDCIDYD